MPTIDLSQLPAPLVVEPLDFDSLFALRKEAFIALYPADQQDAVRLTLSFESEPIVKLLQESIYRELLLRQRVNEGAQAVMVAHAIGSDLDHLGANNGIEQLTITPANPDTIPSIAAAMESNDGFRVRIPQVFEGLSVAGPTGAYEYHARSAEVGWPMLPLSAHHRPVSLLLCFPARATAKPHKIYWIRSLLR